MTMGPGEVARAGRRAFLRWATAIGGMLSAALAGVPALRAFLSPVFERRREEKWIRLGEVDAFDLETPTKVDFVDSVKDAWVETRRLRSVWVYTEDGEQFTVYNGRCTHLGCNFSFDEEKNVFACPCHTGFFDIKGGAVLGGPPPRGLDRLDVRVKDGALHARYQDFRLGVPDKVES